MWQRGREVVSIYHYISSNGLGEREREREREREKECTLSICILRSVKVAWLDVTSSTGFQGINGTVAIRRRWDPVQPFSRIPCPLKKNTLVLPAWCWCPRVPTRKLHDPHQTHRWLLLPSWLPPVLRGGAISTQNNSHVAAVKGNIEPHNRH